MALAACCRELVRIIDMVDEIGKDVRLSHNKKTNMHIVIHKDNIGVLLLAQSVPPHEFTL